MLPAGLLTPAQLRSRAWRRLRPDVYADAELPVTHLLHARAVRLVAPTEAVFAGLTAVVLWGGAEFATAADPVEVVRPTSTRWQPGPGVTVRNACLDGGVVTDRTGWRRTSRVRTAVDLIRRSHLDDGVVLLDRLVNARIVPLEPVGTAVAAHPRCRGRKRAREVVALADGLAESPQETRLRLTLLRGGLPPPTAQHRVFDAQGFIARLDLAYPELKTAIEYDGAWHGERGQLRPDRERLNRLTAAGWIVLHLTAADLHNPRRVVAQVWATERRQISRRVGSTRDRRNLRPRRRRAGSGCSRGCSPGARRCSSTRP